MYTFAQKPKAIHPTTAANSAILSRAHFAQSRDPNSIFNWQYMIQNQAVQRLLEINEGDVKGGPAIPETADFDNVFSRVRVHTPIPRAIRTKLAVNEAGDEYEQEADRISEQVMRMSEPHLQRACACEGTHPKCQMGESGHGHNHLQTQRFGSSDHGQTEVPPIVHEVLRSSGQPLDPEMGAFMQSRFGHDFSNVRVHTDARAAQSAQAVNALAYTVGRHAVFADSQYQPSSERGRRLLAHELVHAIQQVDHGEMPPQRLTVGRTDDILETQAEALADYVVLPSSRGPSPSTQWGQYPGQPVLRRQPCRKADDRIVTGPLAEQLPNIQCDPKGEPLATVRAASPAPNILGVTKTTRASPAISYQELDASRCKATISSYYTMSIAPFMYTKEGTYDDGMETRPRGGCCERQRIRKKLMITRRMAQMLRAGEIEHCEDHKLAFAKSEGKFNQAIRDLEGEYCPDTTPPEAPPCKEEFAQRFRDRTGFDFAREAGQFSQCLHDKTKLRDNPPNSWHSVISNDFFCAPDCSSITYIASSWMPNIGTHASSEIVKDCLPRSMNQRRP